MCNIAALGSGVYGIALRPGRLRDVGGKQNYNFVTTKELKL